MTAKALSSNKRQVSPTVNIYFAARERKILEKFLMIAQKYKISESRLGVMAMRHGLRAAVKELDTQETKTDIEV